MTDFGEAIQCSVQAIARFAGGSRHCLATAESCTGGLVAAALTAQAGASAFFAGGVVAYSNAQKINWLGVRAATLENYGAVSEEVAREMCDGCFASNRDITAAVATTGVAGPDGGSRTKPVGTVCFALRVDGVGNAQPQSTTQHFAGDRRAVQHAATQYALQMFAAFLSQSPQIPPPA